MEWIQENFLALTSLVLAIVGSIFALVQWRKSVNMQRAKFIEQIIEKLRFDEDMTKAFNLIDYSDDEWYNEDFHGGSDNEFLIDKLLSYLTYICYLLEMKHIGKEETKILTYELNRVCSCFGIRAYLWNLRCFAETQETICSFQYIIDYGIKHRLFDKLDFEKACDKFPKYLNF